MKSMIIAALMPVAALIGGCTSEGARAEKRYEIVASDGSATDRCDAARAVQSAYLADEDDPAYREWRSRADRDCMRAELHEGAEKIIRGY